CELGRTREDRIDVRAALRPEELAGAATQAHDLRRARVTAGSAVARDRRGGARRERKDTIVVAELPARAQRRGHSLEPRGRALRPPSGGARCERLCARQVAEVVRGLGHEVLDAAERLLVGAARDRAIAALQHAREVVALQRLLGAALVPPQRARLVTAAI